MRHQRRSISHLTSRRVDATEFHGTLTGKATLNSVQGNALRAFLDNALLAKGTLVISATPEKFKTTTTAIYNLGGIQRTKSATDNLEFSVANTINVGTDDGDFHGAWLVQINAAGTVSTLPAGGLADQVYATKAAAIAALPAPTAANVVLGYITVTAKTNLAWTANTDDMTDESDCEEATFVDAAEATLPALIA